MKKYAAVVLAISILSVGCSSGTDVIVSGTDVASFSASIEKAAESLRKRDAESLQENFKFIKNEYRQSVSEITFMPSRIEERTNNRLHAMLDGKNHQEIAAVAEDLKTAPRLNGTANLYVYEQSADQIVKSRENADESSRMYLAILLLEDHYIQRYRQMTGGNEDLARGIFMQRSHGMTGDELLNKANQILESRN